VILDGTIPAGEIERMIDNSFMLVVKKMTKKDQQSINILLYPLLNRPLPSVKKSKSTS